MKLTELEKKLELWKLKAQLLALHGNQCLNCYGKIENLFDKWVKSGQDEKVLFCDDCNKNEAIFMGVRNSLSGNYEEVN